MVNYVLPHLFVFIDRELTGQSIETGLGVMLTSMYCALRVRRTKLFFFSFFVTDNLIRYFS